MLTLIKLLPILFYLACLTVWLYVVVHFVAKYW